MTDGLKLFAWGMLKKIVIADRIAPYVNFVYDNASNQYGLALLLATVLYSFQIYCDFSGYSDMAIGLARYLGFDAGKNFDHPYFSKSVGEFWRRWHISLSSWLRDYVYIPLGGSHVVLPRIYLNLLVTFLVSGIWHGAGWSFVAWGLLHGFYLCFERATKQLMGKINFSTGFKIFITFCLVSFAWVFFRAVSAKTALVICRRLARIPLEIIQFVDLQKAAGLKNAIRTMFAISPESCGNLRGMAKTVMLLGILLVSEVLTLKTSGLALLRSNKADIRWLAYILCTLALLKALPLKISFEKQHSYSTNFIYQNF